MTAATHRATRAVVGYANRMSRVQPSAIRELLRLGTDPDIVSFGGGYPDPALFPIEELHQVYADLLSPDHAAALQYTASNGLPQLRTQVAERLTRDGMPADADDVLIIQGGQQGLDLAAKLVINAGDVIITENPTFLGALIAFAPTEPRYAPVRSDADGMDTDHLAEVLAAHPDAKMIYTVPDFANPSGTTLSLPRRRRLIELANAYGLLVLEDTPYRPLRYEGESLPTLKSLDTEGRVLHLGSFSKILAPGMRLGWATASPEILERIALLKLAADTQNSTLNMAATSAYLARYDIDAHIADALPVYRHKRDLMLATMAETFPDGGRVHPARRRPVHLADLPGRFRRGCLHGRCPAAGGEGRVRAGGDLLPRPPAAPPRPGQLLRRTGRSTGARHHRAGSAADQRARLSVPSPRW